MLERVLNNTQSHHSTGGFLHAFSPRARVGRWIYGGRTNASFYFYISYARAGIISIPVKSVVSGWLTNTNNSLLSRAHCRSERILFVVIISIKKKKKRKKERNGTRFSKKRKFVFIYYMARETFNYTASLSRALVALSLDLAARLRPRRK